MLRCEVCEYHNEGAVEKCPKCDSPKEKFKIVEDEKAKLIEMSRKRNEMHVAIMGLYAKVQKWATTIKEENLDPACVVIAKRQDAS